MFPIRDHNPSGRTPFVTYALLAANVLVFLVMLPIQQDWPALREVYLNYALIPALVHEGQGYTGLVTSMFLHGGWMHIIFNMLFLHIFGDNMEDEMGHVGFALFYVACGVLAGLAQYLADPTSTVPMVGASGAIAGVMGGYLLLFPKARVDVVVIIVIIFKIFPVPAWIMLMLWFGLQLLNGFGTPTDAGGVAYWAHAGGFVAGMLLSVPLWLRLGGPAFWNRTEGHPPHPEAEYVLERSRIPRVRRK